ncbi:MAG TPA: zinc ribbon domain-containing protein [Thermomicrobiales bacterium]|nr:zinc ribbon domain-containing protein [Thermomicrobiales bacterium]
MRRNEAADNARVINCPACGEHLWVQDRFCPECGAQVPVPPAEDFPSTPAPQPPTESGDASDSGTPRWRIWRRDS